MAFRGWPVEALEFYEALEADNSKAFWQRHKETYETHRPRADGGAPRRTRARVG